MEDHNTSVAAILRRVKIFHDTQQPFRIFHGSTNSTRKSQYTKNNSVDVSSLNNVLSINEKARTALVEPNVPMDRLVDATLMHGLVPPIVMEFPGITAGGGFSGTAGESSSFRYGFFDRTVLSVEIVLGNGEVVTASKDNYSDLFYGAASSFGTMGIVTLLEISLLEAQPYVALTYTPVNDVTRAVTQMEQLQKDESVDYIDAILFSKDSGVVLSGRLTNNISNMPVQRFSGPWDPWFYMHTERQLRKASAVTEAIPLKDYLFRYDRGGFWVGKYAFQYFVTPFNFITRRLLDCFMHTRVMYHALHKSGHSGLYIIQDVAVPYPAAGEFLDYLEETFGNYPLWLCPLIQTRVSPLSPRVKAPENEVSENPRKLMNFGVWGPGPKSRNEFVRYNRALERKVHDLGGIKWLYAHAYYTEEEFWEIYDRKSYDGLRQKYYASHLPTIFDKVKVDVAAEKRARDASLKAWLLALFWSIWPFSGVYGVMHTILRTDYLMKNSGSRSKVEKNE